MKTLRKLIMGLLVSIMVLGMGVTAFAAAGTITVKGAKEKQEYDAYRVFDYVPADESNADAGGVYKLNPAFAGFETYVFNYTDENNNAQTANMADFFKIGDNDIIDPIGLKADADAAIFGRAAVAYALANGISADGSTTATADGDATISVPEFGYYVINSSLGTAVAVDTTTPNVEVQEKNKIPNLNKEETGATNDALVFTDLTGGDHQIGDTIEYTITAELKVGGKGYAIYDDVTEGLTLNEITDTNISFAPDDAGLTWTIDNSYENPDNGRKGFEIKFDGEPNKDTVVTVTYTAVLNEDAVINPSPNINEAFLTYGRKGTVIETHDFTYPVAIRKTAKGDPEEKLLKDAKFQIFREFDNSQVKLAKVSDTEYKVDPNGSVTEFTTVEADNILITGLAPEKYVLVETQAPKGYNLLEGKVTVGGTTYEHAQEVVVNKSSTVEAVQVEKVEDGTGLTLPSTGGIGTTIFYIVGGILIVAGIAYFIVRRKADAE
ncbi:isopeptide-forming domain-containing fimbrial protein [Butyrivibrio sp. XB500-5]|uniref:isopeptide-forming domain-containing fimbrial protein n=1 Tax=Butyrivibrio sp. XB500-5 TaxID=2364880 RepID=UPI000EA99C71|nr:SpaA isopeptide-forming pilin-related protein [Butyrivibrio sp. XB500-5]RKM60958.1 isopeptide-forming domain-containing fimbrial protein [Butyrivibrio sp. XB500-5]